MAVGIVCSSAVSALIAPQRSSLALRRALQIRYTNFTAFAFDVLGHGIERGQFERRFADLVDEIVGFEATRAFAAFEDPAMRLRSQHLGRLNGEFMDACARLHALHQLLKRLRANGPRWMVDAITPYFHELSELPAPSRGGSVDASHLAARMRLFQASLPRRVRETRRPLEAAPAESLADFDTAAELLYRFVDEWIRYSETYASLARSKPGGQQRTVGRYVNKTNGFVVAFTFARSAAVMAIAGWFWIATDWPSGGFAVIGAALACALTSAAPNGWKMAVQMAVGAVLATT